MERSEIHWGRTTIPYAIQRSARRRTVGVTVAPPGAVVLTAPPKISVQLLDAVVRSKARWISARLRLVHPSEPRPASREFVSGESFLYLGRQYRLAVGTHEGAPGVRLERGRLQVTLASLRDAELRADAVRALLVRWYWSHAQARLEERAQWWARRVGLDEPRVRVRNQHRRWGSCAPGVLRFNWRIVQAPVSLVDYVVVHELTHLLHDDHGKAFWAALGRALPDYEVRRAALRRLGPSLDW